MKEIVHVMMRDYERALPYGKLKIDEKMRPKDERSSEAEWDESCPVRDETTITIDEKARDDDTSVWMSSAASLASDLVWVLKERIIKVFWDLMKGSYTKRWQCSGYGGAAPVCEIQKHDRGL